MQRLSSDDRHRFIGFVCATGESGGGSGGTTEAIGGANIVSVVLAGWSIGKDEKRLLSLEESSHFHHHLIHCLPLLQIPPRSTLEVVMPVVVTQFSFGSR